MTPVVKHSRTRCAGSLRSTADRMRAAQSANPAMSPSRNRTSASSVSASTSAAPVRIRLAARRCSAARGLDPAYCSTIPRVKSARPRAGSDADVELRSRPTSRRVRATSPATKASSAAAASLAEADPGSLVSAAARSRASEDAAYPKRTRSPAATRSSSSARTSSGPVDAAARWCARPGAPRREAGRQGPVRAALLVRSRQPEDRGPQQRVAEPVPLRVGSEDAGGDRLVQCGRPRPPRGHPVRLSATRRTACLASLVSPASASS